MKLFALALFLSCAHTQPAPPPTDPPACIGVTVDAFDTLADRIVTALGDDMSWEKQVDALAAATAPATFTCIMSNVATDLDNAPVEQSRARDWLGKHRKPN